MSNEPTRSPGRVESGPGEPADMAAFVALANGLSDRDLSNALATLAMLAMARLGAPVARRNLVPPATPMTILIAVGDAERAKVNAIFDQVVGSGADVASDGLK